MSSAHDSDRALLDALTGRLARLEDERAILETLHLYGQTIDSGDAEGWADLFAEDGIFLCVDRDGGFILREQGRAALAQWVRALKSGETLRLKHIVIAPVVTLDGDTARVASYYTNMTEADDPTASPRIRFMGRYDDEMVRDASGRWLFRQRISRTEAPLLAPPPAAQ